MLFDRPTSPGNTIDNQQHNQRKYIEGPFALHDNLSLDKLDIRDLELQSNGEHVANLSIDDNKIVTVTSLGERISWSYGRNAVAYSVIFDGTVAHVKWT